MSSTSAASAKINPDSITERYSNLSRADIETLGKALLKDTRIIGLLEGKGIKDTAPIQLIFNNKTSNSLPPSIRPMMLKTDIPNLITKMQLKGKEPDTLFIVLNEIMNSLAELGGGGRRRRHRKTKQSRKTRRTRRNNKKRST